MTHTAVEGVYEQLAGALESIDATPYASPGGQRSATTALGTTATPVAAQVRYTTTSYTTTSGQAPTTPAGTTPADTSAPAAPDNSDPRTRAQQPAQPVGPNSVTTPTAASIAADDSCARTTGGASGAGSGTPNSVSSAASGPVRPDPKSSSSADMGTVGVWRPGDIANVLDAASKITGSVPGLLQGIGAAATGVGDLFKDVVGQDGVTGLIREGVDAAGKIDNMVEHHLDPTAANHDTSAPTGGNDHNTGGGGTDSNAPVQQTAGIHTTDTTSTGASQDQATPAPGHAIQSNISQSMSTTPSGYQPFNLGSSTTTTSAGASAGSFVSSPMMQSRGEESEHRPKFLYKFPAATGDEPGQPGTDNQHQSTDSEQP